MAISIFGAGAFGTSLAIMYSKFFERVGLYSCFQDHVEQMQTTRINHFLPDYRLPDNIDIGLLPFDCDKDVPSDTASDSVDSGNYIFWAFPVKVTSSILNNIKHLMHGNIVICSKGLLETGDYLFELFERELTGCTISYLAGPNFATDIASLKFSCANIGSRAIEDANRLALQLSTAVLRLYPTSDIVGMQICAAVKNVVAIACGMMSGLDYGQDAHAAIVTLGLHELVALGVALGCDVNTFYTFCGIGDMLLTSSSELSRNMSLGKTIAINATANPDNIKDCVKNNVTTCEGYNTINQLLVIADKYNVDMPICRTVHDIINCRLGVHDIVKVFS